MNKSVITDLLRVNRTAESSCPSAVLSGSLCLCMLWPHQPNKERMKTSHDILKSVPAREVFQFKNGQIRSHYTISQKSESYHRSHSHFAAPMMVLYTIRANDSGTKLPN